MVRLSGARLQRTCLCQRSERAAPRAEMSIIRSGGGRPDRHLGHLRGPEYRGLPLDLRSGGGSASNSENINHI